MQNSYCHAKLVSMNKISVMTFNSFPRQNDMQFKLFRDDSNECINLKLIKSTSNNMLSIFELELPHPYEFGVAYSLILTSNIATPIDVSDAINFPEFDNLFNYDKDDLGAIYSKDQTTFSLWAPLATNVVVCMQEANGEFKFYPMNRTDHGVYRTTIKGDLLNRLYTYYVLNNGVTRETNDPYSYGVGLNSKYSAVVDLNAIKKMGKVALKTKLEKYVNHIIYETNIRDLTEQKGDSTNIVNKGKYLGFVEKNRKTKGGFPAGLDYLLNLGITTVQLNPVIDFGSVKDDETDKQYNWGYDPINTFSLEGSYSLHPEIPMERLIEFKTMVNELHKVDLRVVLDVVYNHTYEYMTSCYEKILPDYFFRRAKNGNLANACGCGNDFSSERFMGRKLIVDSIKYFTDVFDVDGFRFDLMGLIDIKTINHCYEEAKKIKDDLIFYGEGWNMGLELPYEEKACSDNAYKIPHIGFFNETFRDIVKGPTFETGTKGYIGGDLNYAFGLKYTVHGSCCNISYSPKFQNANQSVNYIECHDNHTVFDKLKQCNSEESIETILRRCQIGCGIVMTSFGIPFIHMGQEIGLSKKGNGNTYNVLNVNSMDYKLVDERLGMVNYLKGLCRLRKEMKLFSLTDPEEIYKSICIYEKEGTFVISCTNPELINGKNELCIMINPQNKPIAYELENEYKLLVGVCGYMENSPIVTRHILCGPTSCVVVER